MIVLKDIRMTLDLDSIDKSIREIAYIESHLKPAMQCLLDYLGEKGVEIARAELLLFDDPAYRTGALSESMTYRHEGEEVRVIAGEGLHDGYSPPQSYAVYVEYGTGIYGADINDHGLAGWWYPAPWGKWEKNGQKYAWTQGMPPRPFMTNTLHDLEDEARVNGGRIVADYIRGERA